MRILTLSLPRRNLPPILVRVPANRLSELARLLAQNCAINSGTPLQGMAIGAKRANSPDGLSGECHRPSPQGASQAQDGGEAESEPPGIDQDQRHENEFASLTEALAYWAAKLAEADDALAPWKARENGNKENILATHGRFDRTLLDEDRRKSRVALFAERDRLLPFIGPLRKRRQECAREVKTLNRRLDAERAMQARMAKSKRRTRS